MHWCPGCGEMHPLPATWKFNGDLEKPTFSPSFRQSWRNPRSGVEQVCHYNIEAGEIFFHADCTHDLRGAAIPMPDLPPELCD